MALTLEWRDRINAWRDELPRHFYDHISPIKFRAAFTTQQYHHTQVLDQLEFHQVESQMPWGAKWEYGWFKSYLVLPDDASGQMIALKLDVGAEVAVFINGDYAGAVDEKHTVLILSDAAKAGAEYLILLEAYAGHGPRESHAGPTPPWRETVTEPPAMQCVVGESHFGVWDEEAFQLAIDVETLWEVRENTDPESLRVMEIDEGLKEFTLVVNFETNKSDLLASFQQARDILIPLLEKQNGDSTPEMIGFGHGHIDVAWLWPLEETERKCVRTFSTQLALMDRYPEYRFLQSQPHLYQMMKTSYPDLYEKIKTAVRKGQWIPEGAAWVEPDTNITGGESLIRQMIHGKRFFKDEFGIDSKLLWIPDVFGYSGALPQIMVGCGVPYFSTQKIFWAYHGGEPFPYNTFNWEGIDGSQVKAHFHNDYGGETRPSHVIQRWRERVQKDGFSTRLFPFGWGDGGGGATREHLEYARRIKNLEGVPKFRIDDPLVFFREQEAVGWPDVRYVGELYFQAHRGTYTSQARTKRLNRQSEFALREAELWGCAAMVLKGFDFPQQRWDSAWKTLLLNQFHDILPGSSIQKVYEEAEAQLSSVIRDANKITGLAQQTLLKNKPGMTVFNALSWQRHALVALPDGWQGLLDESGRVMPVQGFDEKVFAEVSVPSCGWQSFLTAEGRHIENSLVVKPDLMENDLMRICINECGEITSIYDKVQGQELAAGFCNQMRMYQDIPSQFDAWDIDSVYRLSPVDLREKASIEVLAEGPLFGKLLIRRKLNNSHMSQIITIRRGTRQVDFHTTIDWQERHILLKVNFPVNYFARQALHEIQFGHIPRPTHRSRQADQDQFEVANQKWSALVEPNRGCAILNDCKYGVDVLDNSINLTLLKSALAPDMNADRGIQEFTYAFYFWDTPLIKSGLVQMGYELNVPVNTAAGFIGKNALFELDQPNIIIETIKPVEADDPSAIILRLYESMGTRTKTSLSIDMPCDVVFLTDMLEKKIKQLDINQGVVNLIFTPFEIKTLFLQTK